MTVMQIRCDGCGEIVETSRHKLPLQCEPRPAISSRDAATSDPTINLCKPCFDDLHEWFAEELIYVGSSLAAAWGVDGSLGRGCAERPGPEVAQL